MNPSLLVFAARLPFPSEEKHNMDMKQAMVERHMVRKYTDKPIPTEIVRRINGRVSDVNAEYRTDIELVRDDGSAFNAAIKLILAKGVRNYFILAGRAAPDLRERLGAAGADLMLFCQTLGLNTWWVGGTYSHAKMAQKAPGDEVIGIIAVGYGATQGKPHKSKSAQEVATYEGPEPEWFKNGVEAALLAPTALGKQAFKIEGAGDEVSITYEPGAFAGEDLGLVKYHFALGVGSHSFCWKAAR